MTTRRAGLIIVAEILFLFFLVRGIAEKVDIADFGAYWAAAQLATTNPYSHEEVLKVERGVGWKRETPLIMRNPPWTLPFVTPLQWFSYPTALALWTMASITAICGGSLILWRLYGGQTSIASLLLPIMFGPTLNLIQLGQFISALPFLGWCLFLVNIEYRRDWIAGASLFLILLKPHLFLPALVCLGLWIVRNRRFRVLAAAAMMFFAASSLAMGINQQIFELYKEVFADVSDYSAKPPTLGVILHYASDSLALAMVPTVIAVIWALWFWWRKRRSWEWKNELPVLLLVSLVSGYYMMFYDEAALLAALIPLAVGGGRRFWIAYGVVNAVCLVYLLGWLKGIPGFVWSELLLSFWSTVGWCAVYLATQKYGGLLGPLSLDKQRQIHRE